MVGVGSESCQGGHDDSVRKGDMPDLEGLEKERIRHCNRCNLLVLLVLSVLCRSGG